MVDALQVRCSACDAVMQRQSLKHHSCDDSAAAAVDVTVPVEEAVKVDSNTEASKVTNEARCPYCALELSTTATAPTSAAAAIAPTEESLIASHVRTECSRAPVPCKFARYGCDFRAPRDAPAATDKGERTGLGRAHERHLQPKAAHKTARDANEDHERVPLCAFAPLAAFFSLYDEQLSASQDERDALKSRLDQTDREVDSLRRDVEALRASLGEFLVPSASSSATRPSTSRHSTAAGVDAEGAATSEAVHHRPRGHRTPKRSQRAATEASTHDQQRQAEQAPTTVQAADERSTLVEEATQSRRRQREAQDEHEAASLLFAQAFAQQQAAASATSYPTNAPSTSTRTPESSRRNRNVVASPLSAQLGALGESLGAVGASVGALEHRTELALMKETIRLDNEMQSLRGVVHGVRMQTHYLLMELNRLTASSSSSATSGQPSSMGQPNATSPAAAAVAAAATRAMSSSSTDDSDDERASRMQGGLPTPHLVGSPYLTPPPPFIGHHRYGPFGVFGPPPPPAALGAGIRFSSQDTKL